MTVSACRACQLPCYGKKQVALICEHYMLISIKGNGLP